MKKKSRTDRDAGGGKTETHLARTAQAEPIADRDVPAFLAHAARADARRARRGDRRRGPRAAGAAQLSSGLVVPRRRRRMGRDAAHGARPRARRGGGRDAHGRAGAARHLLQFRELPGRPHRRVRGAPLATAGRLPQARRDRRSAHVRLGRICPSGSIRERALGSPRFSTGRRSGRCGECVRRVGNVSLDATRCWRRSGLSHPTPASW